MSAQIWYPFCAAVPGSEKLPVIGSEMPILIGAAASGFADTCVATTSEATAATASRATQRNLRICLDPPCIEREELRLRHLLDCVAKPLAACSGRLHAAVRH